MNPSKIPFCTALVERHTAERKEAAWVASQAASPTVRYLPVRGGENLFADGEEPHPLLLTAKEAEEMGAGAERIFLGSFDETPYFALLLPGETVKTGRFSLIQRFASLISPLETELLLLARALAHWRENHRHCGRCGATNELREGGHLLCCPDPACGAMHFPRTDPAVIVLVEWEDKCLLGRQPGWPEKMHSCLAGFVDPGETIENAVRREVREEAGVEVGEVRYLASQPWPFPSSLMLGFRAVALSGELAIDHDEIETARWFTREEVRAGVEAGELMLPRGISISRWLIDDWLGS